MAREVKQWITVNGVHVPIFEGQSKEEAVKQAISRQKKRGPVSSDTRKKAVADYVDKKRQYRDAYDRVEIEQRHYDRASNKEDRDAAKDRLKVASKDRDSKLQEYAKASDRVANLGKGGKVRRGTEFGKSGKQGQITHYSDIKQVPKKLKPGEQYALYLKKGEVPNDGSKFAGQTYNAEYQGKGTYGVSNPKNMSPVAGFKTYEAMKKAYEERSQHPGQSYEIAVIKSGDNKKEEQQKQMGPAEKEARELANNPSGKLSKAEKFHIQMREEKRRREQGIKTKYTSPDHSKLSQHSEIQKIAEAHNEAVWTREGGVANKELYDAADKFAEQHNLPKDKVRKAAMAAFMEKHSESIKRRDAGQEPVEKKKATPEDYAKKQGLSLAEMSKQVANHPEASKMASKLMEDGMSYHEAGALAHQTYKDKLSNDSKIESAVTKGSSSEFKNRDEAEAFYRNKFAGVSATYANKMAKKLGIEGRGKDKREALAKHYTDQWETKSNVSKNEDEKEKQIARNESEAYKRKVSEVKQYMHPDEARKKVESGSYDSMAKQVTENRKKLANTTNPDEKRNLINENHELMKKMDKQLSSFGQDFQNKANTYREKFLTKKSDNEERNSAIQSLRNSGLSQEDAERKVDRMSPDEVRKLGGTQSTLKLKKIPASQVTISDSQYRFSTGKAPKGYGNWAFYIGNSDEPVFFHGSYAEAKKKAIREAANRGVNKIRVGS